MLYLKHKNFNMLTFPQYEFPQPKYLGAKYKLTDWIRNYIPDDVRCSCDLFAGSNSVAYMFKTMGHQVITNDYLACNYHIGKALIENTNIRLTTDDLQILFSNNKYPEHFNLIETQYTNLFFTQSDAQLLDAFRSNVDKLTSHYKQSLALMIMCRVLTRKITMGHFCHTRALEYAASPERIKRDPQLLRSIQDLFVQTYITYEKSIFNNGQNCLAYNHDVYDMLELMSQNNKCDLIYFDPPYCGSHADYQSYYHLLETFCRYWKDKQFVNTIKRYEPKLPDYFTHKNTIIKNFDRLFSMSNFSKYWLVSYNDNSFPDVETMKSILGKYKYINVIEKPYLNCNGGRGQKKHVKEILFFCY